VIARFNSHLSPKMVVVLIAAAFVAAGLWMAGAVRAEPTGPSSANPPSSGLTTLTDQNGVNVGAVERTMPAGPVDPGQQQQMVFHVARNGQIFTVSVTPTVSEVQGPDGEVHHLVEVDGSDINAQLPPVQPPR